MNHPVEQPVLELYRLPNELIRRVAAQCPGRTLLALCATSHFIRSTCYDFIVFRDSVFNRLQEAKGETRAQDQIKAISTREPLKIRARSKTWLLIRKLEFWAEYAVAIDKADHLHLPELETLLDPQIRDKIFKSMMVLVPPLLAIGYTPHFQGNLAQLLTIAGLTRPDGSRAYGLPAEYMHRETHLSFWFAAEAIAENTIPSSASIQHDSVRIDSELETLAEAFLRFNIPFNVDRPIHYFLVGLFMRLLRGRGHRGPNLRSVPLNLHSHGVVARELVPLPFTKCYWDMDVYKRWLRSRTKLGLKRLDLGTTEWCGYLFGDSSLQISEKLRFVDGIQLQNQDESSGAIGSVRGTGNQGNRSFTLEGSFRKDLMVFLEQKYPGLDLPQCH